MKIQVKNEIDRKYRNKKINVNTRIEVRIINKKSIKLMAIRNKKKKMKN